MVLVAARVGIFVFVGTFVYVGIFVSVGVAVLGFAVFVRVAVAVSWLFI
jgi:hypothetical protein